jgi:hypothetical protein
MFRPDGQGRGEVALKAKLKSDECILTEKRQSKDEVWKPFHDVQDAATKGKNGAVHRLKCQFVSSYSAKKLGSSHLIYHSCKLSATQSIIEKYLHPLSSRIPEKVEDSD